MVYETIIKKEMDIQVDKSKKDSLLKIHIIHSLNLKLIYSKMQLNSRQ